jgi:hypothetical protein
MALYFECHWETTERQKKFEKSFDDFSYSKRVKICVCIIVV